MRHQNPAIPTEPWVEASSVQASAQVWGPSAVYPVSEPSASALGQKLASVSLAWFSLLWLLSAFDADRMEATNVVLH